jgi:hypothetical protein
MPIQGALQLPSYNKVSAAACDAGGRPCRHALLLLLCASCWRLRRARPPPPPPRARRAAASYYDCALCGSMIYYSIWLMAVCAVQS